MSARFAVQGPHGSPSQHAFVRMELRHPCLRAVCPSLFLVVAGLRSSSGSRGLFIVRSRFSPLFPRSPSAPRPCTGRGSCLAGGSASLGAARALAGSPSAGPALRGLRPAARARRALVFLAGPGPSRLSCVPARPAAPCSARSLRLVVPGRGFRRLLRSRFCAAPRRSASRSSASRSYAARARSAARRRLRRQRQLCRTPEPTVRAQCITPTLSTTHRPSTSTDSEYLQSYPQFPHTFSTECRLRSFSTFCMVVLSRCCCKKRVIHICTGSTAPTSFVLLEESNP